MQQNNVTKMFVKMNQYYLNANQINFHLTPIKIFYEYHYFGEFR